VQFHPLTQVIHKNFGMDQIPDEIPSANNEWWLEIFPVTKKIPEFIYDDLIDILAERK